MHARLTADHPYPRAFLTVSGAHLYGFPSEDSDIDLRGAHLLPPDAPGPSRLRDDVAALTARLEDERDRSDLPEAPANRRALHELGVRARLG
jgi:predicted nucleotidyltransferase